VRKIAFEEHFIDPALARPPFGDSFSGVFAQSDSGYDGFSPDFSKSAQPRPRDLHQSRIEEMEAASIDIAILPRTVGGVGANLRRDQGGFTNFGEDQPYLDELHLGPVWAALGELDVPLCSHPRLPALAVHEAVYRGHLELVGATWGFAPESATRALQIVRGGVFDRERAPISENDRRKICYDNAATLFGLTSGKR
jgi:predicted TIM-barrel fold metal-dependent hydrolase